ncbi:hypothetical protein MKX01_010548 [Papaver californicum]|nr:hypothetical protein MKX01_010548 [Papaver californicum]
MYSDDDIYDDDDDLHSADCDYNDEDNLPDKATKEAPQKNCTIMHKKKIYPRHLMCLNGLLMKERFLKLLHVGEICDVAGCGHLFCESCWKGYIGTSVNDGPECLKLRYMINAFICEESKQKYSSYLLRSYIEDNREFKWCPAPDCKESHSLVDCSTVEKWILKNNDEAENVTWILVHSEPCPQCKRPIEKSIGCNHMNCSICRFRFCWICLDNGANDSMDKNTARKHLMKYTHYYRRWAANHKSMDHAVKYMKNMQRCARVEELCFILCLADEEELKFIKDAWEKIIECRRVLKWSYAFDITCLNMNMQRYTSLSMCKVRPSLNEIF